jgi:PKD repeat protein
MKFNIYSRLVLVLFSLAIYSASYSQCSAGFNKTITGLSVQFANQAIGSNLYLEYDFGDGEYLSYVPNPTHVYDEAGIYAACQFIYDTVSGNCYDQFCDTLYLGGATCMANFYPYVTGLDLEIYDASLGIFDSIWIDFGDGNGSNDPYATHTYSSDGTYTVCLSIFNNGSLCDSMCYNIEFGDCNSDFTYSANNLNVNFTNQSTGNFDVVSWDFGDGFGYSNQINPTYTFLIAGTYTVCLEVYDTLWGSCYGYYCQDVTVTSGGGGGGGGPCQANFSYEDDQLELSFTNTSTGDFLFNTWDFGDGSAPVFDTDPIHTYAEAGTYDVCLNIVNPLNFCFNQYCESITVKEYTCEPTFTYSFNEFNGFAFTNTTTIGNVTSVLWTFGDGNSSKFDAPTYFYNAPGTYNVCLYTYDAGNECGLACDTVNVYPLGIKDAIIASDFAVFPNPSNGQFSVSIPLTISHESLQFTLMDVSGRILQRSRSNGSNMMVFENKIPAGVYRINILSEGGNNYTLPVLVQ